MGTCCSHVSLALQWSGILIGVGTKDRCMGYADGALNSGLE